MATVLQNLFYVVLMAGLVAMTLFIGLALLRAVQLQLLDLRLRHQFNNQDYPAALKTVERQLRINPGGPELYFQRARIYARLGDLQAAEADYTFGMRFSTGAAAYAGRAAVRLALGRLKEALVDANHVIACSRRWWRGYYERGRIYSALGHYRVALEDFDQALELNRLPPPEIYLARAGAADQLGDSEAAGRDRQRAAELACSETVSR